MALLWLGLCFRVEGIAEHIDHPAANFYLLGAPSSSLKGSDQTRKMKGHGEAQEGLPLSSVGKVNHEAGCPRSSPDSLSSLMV
ncbi:hypothetical protein NDU88_002003 [Pleurodeles waltl]|uniref:Secreted protein n=1 Tax=Pleurodeles waltl TaxID=8319 RepID=A0AAV7VY13_PLEWA|nr:hypothetical protein NDU88_002003 [Pleurodeles waltl]